MCSGSRFEVASPAQRMRKRLQDLVEAKGLDDVIRDYTSLEYEAESMGVTVEDFDYELVRLWKAYEQAAEAMENYLKDGA